MPRGEVNVAEESATLLLEPAFPAEDPAHRVHVDVKGLVEGHTRTAPQTAGGKGIAEQPLCTLYRAHATSLWLPTDIIVHVRDVI
jgi:hypothetical protein